MTILARSMLLVVLVSGAACSSADREGERRRKGDERVGGAIVATVDGVGISAAEVARVAELADLSIEEALARSVDQEVLFAEAERRGYGARWEVRRAVERALVQTALAKLVEDEVRPESIEASAIADAYQKNRERFEKPETRSSVHLLARVRKGADAADARRAEAYIEGVLAELGAHPDPGAELEARSKAGPEGLELVFEKLPAVARAGAFERPFEDALFEAAASGLVRQPVRTSYGVHAIVVTTIVPASTVPRSEAEATLRKELVERARFERLRTLVSGLERDHGVVRNEAAWAALLSPTPDEGPAEDP